MDRITLHDRNRAIRVYESHRGVDHEGRLVTFSRYYEENTETGVPTPPRERLFENIKSSEIDERMDNLSLLITMNTISVVAVAVTLFIQALMSI